MTTTPKPRPEVLELCRSCLMAEMRVTANGISTGVWRYAKTTKVVASPELKCSNCERRPKFQLTRTP